jgi:protein-S-isoprenylcysteine O-methyltransferase Ste14
VAIQGVSFGLVWGIHRPAFTSIVEGDKWKAVVILADVLAVVAAVGSVWLITAAVKTLGKEWSLTARLVEGHQLATTGPYARVRHPIYTGMLGMLIATGLAISYWQALLIALVVFFVGTGIRVRSEEKLLREAFGEQFEKYAETVSAIVPGLY